MSRNYSRESRTKRQALGAARVGNGKVGPNDEYKEPGRVKKPKANPKPKKRLILHHRPIRESGSDGDDSADEESETGDEESDEGEDDLPAVFAPPHRKIFAEAGRRRSHRELELLNRSDTESMFGSYDNFYDGDEDPHLSPNENRTLLEQRVFAESDDDNDEIYEAVDDISESDEEEVELLEEQHIQDALISENDFESQEDYLNQIDGLSAYGFGDDSEDSMHLPGSQASDTETVNIQRRVHFDPEPDRSIFMRFSQSPVMSRALLPSKLSESSSPLYGRSRPGDFHSSEEKPEEPEEDIDETDDDIPPEAFVKAKKTIPREIERAKSPTPLLQRLSKSYRPPKGPPKGTFYEAGDKVSGILDPSGKVLLMTNPHLLGAKFAERYNASTSSSPQLGFNELMESSDSTSTQGAADMVEGTDIMLASLNNTSIDPSNNGLAVGPAEAFLPAENFLFSGSQVNFAEFGHFEIGEDQELRVEDILSFDDTGSDSDELTSPIFMPPGFNVSQSFASTKHLEHLNSGNVTAFRDNSGPSYAAFNDRARYPDYSLNTPDLRSKRKRNDSPYDSSHYIGVTPVQRRRDVEVSSPLKNEPMNSTKRRRIGF